MSTYFVCLLMPVVLLEIKLNVALYCLNISVPATYYIFMLKSGRKEFIRDEKEITHFKKLVNTSIRGFKSRKYDE